MPANVDSHDACCSGIKDLDRYSGDQNSKVLDGQIFGTSYLTNGSQFSWRFQYHGKRRYSWRDILVSEPVDLGKQRKRLTAYLCRDRIGIRLWRPRKRKCRKNTKRLWPLVEQRAAWCGPISRLSNPVGQNGAGNGPRNRSARRLERIDVELVSADPLKRLQLTQEQIDLAQELEGMDSGINLTDLENDFVRVASGYADRKGITYAAFRQIGVPASVLKRAGINRAA